MMTGTGPRIWVPMVAKTVIAALLASMQVQRQGSGLASCIHVSLTLEGCGENLCTATVAYLSALQAPKCCSDAYLGGVFAACQPSGRGDEVCQLLDRVSIFAMVPSPRLTRNRATFE